MFKDKAHEGEKPAVRCQTSSGRFGLSLSTFHCEDFVHECNAVIGHLKHLYHEGCDESKDSIELWESGINHGVGLNVVSL